MRYGADTGPAGDFPIVMIDDRHATRASARLFQATGGDARQLIYVQVDFQHARSGDRAR